MNARTKNPVPAAREGRGHAPPDPAATALLSTLRTRFEQHPGRHPGLAWETVQERLVRSPAGLAAVRAMESTGGEPDVLAEAPGGPLAFYDCSAESPAGRRSLCYDAAALAERKENRPAGSAVEAAAGIPAELLDEEAYRWLQRFGAFDLKTSSWLATPADVRRLGGALFGDRRYGRVFTYHNGVQSYYAARGFRVRVVL